MARHLYRFYLYSIYIALLIFIAVVTGQMLNTLLNLTSLRGSYISAPTRPEIVQSVVLTVVAWVIAGILAGLHFWLIRRDIQRDTTAGASAIRAFFLNIPEAIGIVLAVPVMGFLLNGLGFSQANDITAAVAFTVPTFVLVGLLAWERRRTQVHSGAALVFQRLHLYGVQIVLLIVLSFAWFSTINPLIDGLIFGGRGTLAACHSGNDCPTYHMFYLAVSILWFVAFWIGYGWLLRKDDSHILRFILHGTSFAYGLGYVLFGIYIGVELIILPLFGLSASFKDVLGPSPFYNFVPPLTLGILIVGIYHFWLNRAVKEGLINPSVKALMEIAIAALLSAMVFWIGCGNLLYNAFQILNHVSDAPDVKTWISDIAIVVAGLGYIPLEIYLRRRNAIDPFAAAGPRRGLVFALLACGILASVIGGVTVLYLWVIALFGSPVIGWQQIVSVELAVFLVGVILVGMYLWSALKEGYWSRSSKQSVSLDTSSSGAASPNILPADISAPVALPLEVTSSDTVSSVLASSPIQSVTLEGTLDELLAGQITRDEAAAHIRVLLKDL